MRTPILLALLVACLSRTAHTQPVRVSLFGLLVPRELRLSAGEVIQ